MSEELQGGYQTTNEPVSNEPQQQEPMQTEPSSPQDSNFFEVKYNKEPVKVTYDEAPTYIQKGLNYDKVQQQAETYQQQLDRAAHLMGYQSNDEFLQAMDLYEQQQEEQRQQELYQQAGVDPDAFNQLLSNHPAVQYAQQLQQEQAEQQRLANEWGELVQEFPDMTPEKIPTEVFQVQQQRGLSLLDAYLRVNYKNLAQQQEQAAIQKLQQNAVASPGSLGGGDVNHSTNVSKLSASDFNSIVDQVLRGERKQL
jgi:hypothetical protein